jgi:para-aminobenzoate synthetase component 1
VEESVIYLNENSSNELIAFGVADEIKCSTDGKALQVFNDFYAKNQGKYIFGYFSYDLKNEVEDLESHNQDFIGFPSLYFFVPQYVVKRVGSKNVFLQGSENNESRAFLFSFFNEKEVKKGQPIKLEPQITQKEYIRALQQLKNHLQQGDIYEVTYCQNFLAKNAEIHPKETYFKLNNITKAPMSCYVQLNEHYLLSASPERFIKKEKNKLVTQPIKGTARRGLDPTEDLQLKTTLLHDEKERAENVMIVDLVRNDLSRVAQKNSVSVDELFGVYAFPTVHQLISTVSCELKENISILEIIKALFPMGSMTGAPKISAMQLIEKYEQFKRGIFSGAVGYFSPDGDFDFNVIIRSILYNAKEKVISCPVGGAITIQSIPEKEYEECLLKMEAMRKILNGDV